MGPLLQRCKYLESLQTDLLSLSLSLSLSLFLSIPRLSRAARPTPLLPSLSGAYTPMHFRSCNALPPKLSRRRILATIGVRVFLGLRTNPGAASAPAKPTRVCARISRESGKI